MHKQDAQAQPSTPETAQSARQRYERPTVETLDVTATRGKIVATLVESTAPGAGS